ncbi:hypothetical protein SAMN04488056_11323 [Cohaesibacter marisflavi]|uniref:Sulfotransferase domain-containing protein n=1 Tax=Cohaesibacter marisflavi TaxID=655353 RepID=A0A1I5K477_9HYPH|nr:hypothetical protein [Cohaesibacter marisflavi]SFO79882.1 hypothetical protein SAMN04488056_11323 [Cohaesibacter marisflavi]
MAGRKLYLHIGSHKTGTTSIQFALMHNAEALVANGLQFFFQKQNGSWDGFPDLHDWIEYVEADRVVPKGARLSNLAGLVSSLSQYEQDIVVSSENFSFFFEKKHIEELHKALSKIFDEIEVICYLRRQDQHIISHAQEGSKTSRHAEYDLWGNDIASLPAYDKRFDYYLDYNKRIGMWMDVMGDDAVTVRCFDQSRLLKGDTIADFFALLGIENYQPGAWRNVGKTSTQAKLGHLLIGSGADNQAKLFSLIDSLELPKRKMEPSRAEAEDFYNHYREGNAALATRLKECEFPEFFSSDFSEYPEQSTDVWNKDEIGEIFAAVFRVLGSNFFDFTPRDLLQAAAHSQRKGDIDAGIRFLKMAQKIRPDGPHIAKRLKELRDLKQRD